MLTPPIVDRSRSYENRRGSPGISSLFLDGVSPNTGNAPGPFTRVSSNKVRDRIGCPSVMPNERSPIGSVPSLRASTVTESKGSLKVVQAVCATSRRDTSVRSCARTPGAPVKHGRAARNSEMRARETRRVVMPGSS